MVNVELPFIAGSREKQLGAYSTLDVTVVALCLHFLCILLTFCYTKVAARYTE